MTFFGKATEPQPGDLYCASVGGWGGGAIELGEMLNGNPLRFASWLARGRPMVAPGVFPAWKYEHAGIYVGNMTVIMAEPRGAIEQTVKGWGLGVGYTLWSTGLFPDLTDLQRAAIVAAAETAVAEKRGYSWADYWWLAAHRLSVYAGVSPRSGWPAWLRRYIESSGHQQCGQLDDWCYQVGGYHLFGDGRWNGDVTPADLAGNLTARARLLHLI